MDSVTAAPKEDSIAGFLGNLLAIGEKGAGIYASVKNAGKPNNDAVNAVAEKNAATAATEAKADQTSKTALYVAIGVGALALLVSVFMFAKRP